MNIIIFVIFVVLTFIGVKKDVNGINISKSFYYFYFIAFIICGLSRIGNTKEESDLTYYLDYFVGGISTYFEPGYLIFTNIIKTYLGANPYTLIAIIGLIISVCCYNISAIITTKENNNVSLKNRFHYGFILIGVYLTYWGLAFEAERLRIGIATSLMLVSLTLILYGKRILPTILLALALTFQFTIGIIIPVLIFVAFIIRLNYNLIPKRDSFLLWYCILVIIRIILYLTGWAGPVILIMDKMQILIGASDLNHYDNYVNGVIGSGSGYISLKEIFYYVCGFFMICHGTKFMKYNIIVFIYFIGLTLNVFLIGLDAGHRVYDMFLSVNCIAVAYMGWMEIMPKYSFKLYMIFFSR